MGYTVDIEYSIRVQDETDANELFVRLILSGFKVAMEPYFDADMDFALGGITNFYILDGKKFFMGCDGICIDESKKNYAELSFVDDWNDINSLLTT